MPGEPLPIDPHLPAIRARLVESRAVVITALPGAGKTTRVPPALVDAGPVLLLQPRRVAARAIAQRIATEQGWTVGREVGWHVRFDRRASAATRLLVATEGILTARLQQDPLLSDFHTVIVDEFHERSLHADLGLALAKQAWLARTDLRLVVMSATLDTERVAAFLGRCPIVAIPGRLHPVSVSYAPDRSVASAAREIVNADGGHVLCFLPGTADIRRAESELRPIVDPAIEIVPLHGSLDASQQDEAIRPGKSRRVILATNIAETSLTVPDVTAVVDSGLHKVARYDADRAVDSLDLERITRDSADQRAGRAGRVAPGAAVRLWDERDRLAPHREPEIARVDLSGALLDVIAWGGDPRTIEWFERPADDRIDAALALLHRLGAVDELRLTPIGDRMRRFGLHPRLARILVEAHGAREAAMACAILSERNFLSPRRASTSSDLLSAIDEWPRMPPHVQHAAQQLERLARDVLGAGTRPRADEITLRRALLAGYPDRVAQRRAPGSPRVVLASGHGAVIADESGVRDGEFLVAIDVQSGRRGAGAEARVRVASVVDREWLTPIRRDVRHEIDGAGVIRAMAVDLYDELPLTTRHVDPDPAVASALLAEAFLARPLGDEDARLFRRLRFARLDADPRALVDRAAAGTRRLSEIDLASHVHDRRALERLAPDTLRVPSGRSVRLDYRDDGSVFAAVKLQELFGLAETPRIGPGRTPVTLELLAPNGRPVQVTQDLRSFWDRTYPDVRRELRARYPKHPWPDDPWSAAPTARTKRAGESQ